MLSDVLAGLVNATISAYAKGLTSDQLRLSVLGSRFQLTNLELYKYALLQHDIPLIIEKGIIASVDSTFPWANFAERPVICSISDIMILCRPLIYPNAAMPTKDYIYKMRDHQIDSHELFRNSFKNILKLTRSGFFSSTILDICAILQADVRRIHIRIEFDTCNSETCTALGVIIDRTVITGGSKINKEEKSFSQNFLVDGFSVYLDREQTKVNLNKFMDDMSKTMDYRHEWLIDPITSNGHLDFSQKAEGDQIKMDLGLDSINVKVNLWNIPFLLDIGLSFLRFKIFWNARSLKRPDFGDMAASWKFVHKAALLARSKHSDSFRNAPKLFRSFFKYRKLAKNRNRNKAALNVYEHKLPYRLVILYKRTSKVLNSNSNSHNGRKKFKNLQKALHLCSCDAQNLVEKIANQISLNAKCKFINCQILGDSNKGFLLKVLNCSASARHNTKGIVLEATYSNFQMFYINQKMIANIISSVENISNMDFLARITLFNDPSLGDADIRVEMTADNYTIDLVPLTNESFGETTLEVMESVLKYFASHNFKLPYFTFHLGFVPSNVMIHITKGIHLLLSYNVIELKASFTEQIKEAEYKILNVNVDQISDSQFSIVTKTNISGHMTSEGLQNFLDYSEINIDYGYLDKLFKIASSFGWISSIVDVLLDTIKYLPDMPVTVLIDLVSVFLHLPQYELPKKLEIKDTHVDIDIKKLSGKGETKEILLEHLLSIKDAKYHLANYQIQVDLLSLYLKFFNLMELFPKETFSIYTPKLGYLPISINAKDIVLDLSCCNEEILFVLNGIGLSFKDDNIILDGKFTLKMIDYPVIDQTKVIGEIKINKDVFIHLVFDDVNASLNDVVTNFILKLSFPLDTFPNYLNFDWTIDISQIIASNFLQLDGISLHFDMNQQNLFGHLNIKDAQLCYSEIISENPFLYLTFDLQHHYFDAVITEADIFCDPLMMASVFYRLSNFNYFIPKDLKIVLRALPISLHLRFPKDEVTINTSFLISIDSTDLSITGYLGETKVFLDQQVLASIPFIDIYNNAFNIKCIELDFSVWQILRMIELIKLATYRTIYVPSISLEASLPTISISVESILLRLRQQSGKSYGHPFVILNIDGTSISFDLSKMVLNLKTQYSLTTQCSAFEIQTIIPQTRLSIKGEGPKISINNDFVNAQVTPLAISAFHSVFDFATDPVPFFRITNETGLHLTIQVLDHCFDVPHSSTVFQNTIESFSEIRILYQKYSATVITKRLIAGVPITVFFENSKFYFLARVDHNVLLLYSHHQIKNSTNTDFLVHTTEEKSMLSKGNMLFLNPFVDPDHVILTFINSRENFLSWDHKTTFDERHKSFTVSPEYHKDTLVKISQINAEYHIFNKLPFTLYISTTSSITEMLIQPKEMFPFETFGTRLCEDGFILSVPGHIKPTHVPQKIRNGGTSIKAEALDGSTIYLRIEQKKTNESQIISVSCAGLIHNHTNFNLFFSTKRMLPQKNVDSQSFNFKESENDLPSREDITLFSPYYDPSFGLYIGLTEQQVTTQSPVRVTSDNTVKTVFIPLDYNQKTWLPLQVEVIHEIGGFWAPANIHVRPLAVISNHTGKTISIEFADSQYIDISDNSIYYVKCATKSLNFRIVDRSTGISSNILNYQKIESQIINIGFLVDIHIKDLRGVRFVGLNFFNRTSPYRVINNTGLPVTFQQRKTKDSLIIPPYASLPFVFKNPHQQHSLKVKVDKKRFNVNIEKPMFRTKIGKFEYEVDNQLFGGSTLSIYDQNSSETGSSMLGMLGPFEIELTVGRFKAELLYDSQETACIFNTTNLCLFVQKQRKDIEFEFSLLQATIEDYSGKSKYRNILKSISSAKTPFVLISFSMSKLMKFGDFHIDLSPIQVSIDLKYISDMLKEFFVMNQHLVICESEPKYSLITVNTKIPPIERNDNVLKSAQIKSNCDLIFHEDSILYSAKRLVPRSVLKSMIWKHFTISPQELNVSLTTRRSEAANSFYLPRALLYTPDIEDLHMKFNEPLFESVKPSVVKLKTVVRSLSLKNIVKLIISTSLSNEIFGFTSKFMKRLYQALKSESVLGFILIFFHCFFLRMESSINYFNSALHLFANRPYVRNESPNLIGPLAWIGRSVASSSKQIVSVVGRTIKRALLGDVRSIIIGVFIIAYHLILIGSIAALDVGVGLSEFLRMLFTPKSHAIEEDISDIETSGSCVLSEFPLKNGTVSLSIRGIEFRKLFIPYSSISLVNRSTNKVVIESDESSYTLLFFEDTAAEAFCTALELERKSI